MSKVERSIYGHFKLILTDHDKKFSKNKLKSIVRWIIKNFLDASADEIHTIEFWDSVEVKLYNLSIKRDPIVPCMLTIFHTILETLHQQAVRRKLDPSVTPKMEPPLKLALFGPSTMVQNGTGHTVLEHCAPETQDGRSPSAAREPDHGSSTSCHHNHSTSTLGQVSGTPPQNSAILNQGPSSPTPDKMPTPSASPSGNNRTPMVEDTKLGCYTVSNPNVSAPSSPSSPTEGLNSPEPPHPSILKIPGIESGRMQLRKEAGK